MGGSLAMMRWNHGSSMHSALRWAGQCASLCCRPLLLHTAWRETGCFLPATKTMHPSTPTHLQGLGVVLLLDVAVAQAGSGEGWIEGTAFVSGHWTL